MIHSARPTVPQVAAVFSLEVCFVLLHIEKWRRTDGQTTRAKIVITTGRDCGSASWIIKKKMKTLQQNCLSNLWSFSHPSLLSKMAGVMHAGISRILDRAVHFRISVEPKEKVNPKMLLITFVQMVLMGLWAKCYNFI